MPMYKSKVVVVEAMKFDDENKNRVFTWAHQIGNIYANWDHDGSPVINVETPEGNMQCCLGDYLVREPFPTPTRRLYPVKAEVFEARYQIVADEQDNEDDLITKQRVSEAAIAVLERLRKADPSILLHSWKVGNDIADDANIVVSSDGDVEDIFRLRILGLINGILDASGCPKICMTISDDESEIEDIKLFKPKGS